MKKNKFLAVILAMAVAVGAAGVTTYAVGKDANDTEAPSAVLATAASDTEAVKDETVYVKLSSLILLLCYPSFLSKYFQFQL